MSLSFMPAVRRVALSVSLALVASAAVAEDDTAAFRARLVITETVMFTGAPPCFAIGTVQGVGTASQLGNVTSSSTDCINPLGGFNPSGPNSFVFWSQGAGPTGLVFRAANGDALYATYGGTLTAQAAGPHRVSGFFVFTGGTGRFAGASGGGKLSGYEDISQVVSGHGVVEAVGTIRY